MVYATARYVRSSPRKARLVCDHIRGKSVTEARAILAFAPRSVARDWSKLLESAVANAEHQNVKVGKAGRKRHMGVRPQTRGVAMNPVDHPHGGGEGQTTAGRHPVTPWGKPTLGFRTRKKGKRSDRSIIRGRRRGKGKR